MWLGGITGPLVVVVMIHLSLICSGLVWVVDSGDCYLIVVWVVVGESGGLVIDVSWWWFVRLGFGWGGVGGVTSS